MLMPTILPDGAVFNPFSLTGDTFEAYKARRVEEAKAEGLEYEAFSPRIPGAGIEYWGVKGNGSANLHRPGNMPAKICYSREQTSFVYAVNGKSDGARTDGGPIEYVLDETGRVIEQNWGKENRRDGGPTKIWVGEENEEFALWSNPKTKVVEDWGGFDVRDENRKIYLIKKFGYSSEPVLSAHDRMEWETVRQENGGVWWQPQVRETETVDYDGSLIKRTHEGRNYSRLAAHLKGRDLASFGWHAHREDGPAVETFHNGRPYERLWYVAGIAHRKGGPAVERVYEDERKREFFIRDGVQHNPDGPAYVEKDASGKVVAESVFDEAGKRVKASGPLSEVKRALVEEVKAEIVREKPTFLSGEVIQPSARKAYAKSPNRTKGPTETDGLFQYFGKGEER